jgi:hypothetical protein
MRTGPVFAAALLGSAFAATSCFECNCMPATSTTNPPCLGADAGVFIRAAPEKMPVCTASADASVITLSLTDTYCTRLLGETFVGNIPCDVSGVPPGTYSTTDLFGTTHTFALPAVPDGGLAACPP